MEVAAICREKGDAVRNRHRRDERIGGRDGPSPRTYFAVETCRLDVRRLVGPQERQSPEPPPQQVEIALRANTRSTSWRTGPVVATGRPSRSQAVSSSASGVGLPDSMSIHGELSMSTMALAQ